MAKASFGFPVGGSFGDYSMYKMKGVEKMIIRSKGGASKERIKTDPVFETVRYNNSEFAGCGKAAANFRRAFFPISHLADYNYTGYLVTLSKIIQKLDTLSLQGQRSILFSRNRHIMHGFSFNTQRTFDSLIRNTTMFAFNRNELKASVILPQLFPKVNIINTWELSWFRLVVVLGLVPDMIYSEGGYVQATQQVLPDPMRFITEWQSTNVVAQEREVVLKLPGNTALDNSVSMVLSIGAEFGRALSDTVIYPVKYSGSAKILSMG